MLSNLATVLVVCPAQAGWSVWSKMTPSFTTRRCVDIPNRSIRARITTSLRCANERSTPDLGILCKLLGSHPAGVDERRGYLRGLSMRELQVRTQGGSPVISKKTILLAITACAGCAARYSWIGSCAIIPRPGSNSISKMLS